VPTLSRPPSLTTLYARAAATTRLHRGGELPESVYELAPQSIDPRHVAEYARVCGFRYGDVLPPTYLHVLAFGLQVALMSERAFPFPLVGLVHVANSITVHRPVTLDEQVSCTVRAADLRPHAAGTQLDLLSDVAVDGQRVWSGRSTYLRRGGRPPERPSGSKPKRALEPLIGAVSQVRVPADIGRRYAAVSGDRNPIHLSALSARLFGFPSAIAHGMWLKARTLATLEGRLPERFTVEVSFKTPVLLPTTVAIGTGRAGDGWTLDVRNARSGKPHLAGTVSPSA
jgi:acyl dehydratase